jgi:hypothetical protein
MKFKSIILAATALLALVGATTTANNEGEVAASSPSITNIEARNVEAAPDKCYLYCHLPWEKCMEKCGGKDDCSQFCNCSLFGDPTQLCRARRKWTRSDWVW